MSRIKSHEVDNFQFYQIPKSLFSNEVYKGLSLDAKVIYAVLRDRMQLSRKNGWVNQQDEIYLLFSKANLAELLACSEPLIYKSTKQLLKYKLIEEVRQGLGKPNIIYINHVAETIDNTKNLKSLSSRHKENLGLDIKNFNTNDTERSDTEISDKRKDKPSSFQLDGHSLTKDDLTEETKELIRYFFQGYKSKTGKVHPKLNMKWATKVQELAQSETVWDADHDRELMISYDSLFDMIDTYLETDYPLNDGGYADHKMYHFLSDGVLMVLAYRMI